MSYDIIYIDEMGDSIWIPHKSSGRFTKHVTQGECEFQIDKLIWHF